MTKCRTAYQDPTVAYNTGYNDGQREERGALLNALAAFEISVLSDGDCRTMPQVCGRLKRLCREMERGVHRADEARADASPPLRPLREIAKVLATYSPKEIGSLADEIVGGELEDSVLRSMLFAAREAALYESQRLPSQDVVADAALPLRPSSQQTTEAEGDE